MTGSLRIICHLLYIHNGKMKNNFIDARYKVALITRSALRRECNCSIIYLGKSNEIYCL